MVDFILTIFGDVEKINYIEYIFQIMQLIITIITFLTIFMSVHYEENIVKIQKSKMEIKTIRDIEDAKKKLAEYIYINNEANNRYKSILKIFDYFSMLILYVSMICAFIYSIYLNIGSIILIWSIEFIFLMTIFCVSNKLQNNKRDHIENFFDYSRNLITYNKELDLTPKIKLIIPDNCDKSIIEIGLPYFFYNFECILKISDSSECIEILAKGDKKRTIKEEDILSDYVIKKNYENVIRYVESEILIFLRFNDEWKAFSTKINKIKKNNCELIEIGIDKHEYYKQISKSAEIKINEMKHNKIEVMK